MYDHDVRSYMPSLLLRSGRPPLGTDAANKKAGRLQPRILPPLLPCCLVAFSCLVAWNGRTAVFAGTYLFLHTRYVHFRGLYELVPATAGTFRLQTFAP